MTTTTNRLIEKEILNRFNITDEKQEYLSYPCNITEFQRECIIETFNEILEKHLQKLPQPNIEYLKEEITPRESMVEYLEGEKIIRPQYQKKYKTKQEVKAYNDGIKTSIQMIGSCRTMLKELPQQEVEIKSMYCKECGCVLCMCAVDRC